jgi:hypothetical protein
MRKFAPLLAAVAVVAALPTAASAAPYPPDPSWQTDGMVRAIAYGNGSMYLGGAFSSMRPAGKPLGSGEVPRRGFAALDRATGKLQKLTANVNGTVFALAVDGPIVYLGGSFTQVGGKPRQNLAAVNALTGNVTRWKPSAGGVVRALDVAPNGNVFVGGSFTQINGSGRKRIAQVGADGALVPWKVTIEQIDDGSACPPRCSPVVFTIDVAPDGRTVYFGGHFARVNGQGREQAAAVSTTDATDLKSWDPSIYDPENCPQCGTAETHRVYNIMVFDNRALMCGGFWKVGYDKPWERTAFNVLSTNLTDGRPDSTFGFGDDGDTTGCAVKDGVLYVTGHFNYAGKACSQTGSGGKCTDANATRRVHAAAADAVTGALLPWNPSINSHLGAWVVEKGPKTVAFGGVFTRVGGADQQGFARYVTNLAA